LEHKIPIVKTDYLIIGSGIAGLFTALKLSAFGKVNILAKKELEDCNTRLAQGGIAAAVNDEDSPLLHLQDTMTAGAGICDYEAVKVLVEAGAERIKDLLEAGTDFDRKEGGALSLTREGAHSQARILHAADATGRAIHEALLKACRAQENISFSENHFLIDLLVDNENSQCYGALIYDHFHKEQIIYLARAVILGTGGAGQLYQYTTNPDVATGDGMAAAYRAGCELTDLEFIQFHPTALYSQDNQRFLISESVRGEGGLLYNSAGDRFMPKYHPQAELAPRDVVSRAILNEMTKSGDSYVNLDMRHIPNLQARFPTINAACLRKGIDISKDFVPVSPAAHYTMGGIKTNLYGETIIEGIYACGEAACTGVHGANRLASNSLLEGIVFAERVASQAEKIMAKPFNYSAGALATQNLLAPYSDSLQQEYDTIRSAMQKIMWEDVGIIRNKESLLKAQRKIQALKQQLPSLRAAMNHFESANMLTLAALVIEACLWREESRGGHYRSDFPERDDSQWLKHKVFVKNPAGGE
jgi:L-aspartate oxidase